MRRLQLVLWHHHSLAFLPSNYCLSTNVLSYSLLYCSLHTFLLPFLACFTCLSLSLSPLLLQHVCFSSLSPQTKLVGPGWSCRCEKYWTSWLLLHGHTQRHTNLRDLWSYVHSLYVGGCKQLSEEDKRDCEGVAREDSAYMRVCMVVCNLCVQRCVQCLQICWWRMFTVDCWTL